MSKAKLSRSRRPLKRMVRFQFQLGVAYRDGQTRGPIEWVLWTAELPRGKKHPRFMAVVQKITRADEKYSDRIHNPVLFQKIVLLTAGHDADMQAKGALYAAQHAMYWIIEHELEKATRPFVRWRWELSGDPLPEQWNVMEPGNNAEVLGQWRHETMHKLSEFLGNWKTYPQEPWGYLGVAPQIKNLTSTTTNQ